MILYRFSPIKTEEELMEAIKHIHIESYKLCLQSFEKYYPNAGNMGVFCHYDDEFAYLKNLREKLTVNLENPDQKYFQLHEPIVFPATDGVPETTYTHLYIRKPDPYRHHVGDIDFYIEPDEYTSLKQALLEGETITNGRIFPREDLDMIELYNPDSDVLAYLSPRTMTEKVRVKQSKVTNL